NTGKLGPKGSWPPGGALALAARAHPCLPPAKMKFPPAVAISPPRRALAMAKVSFRTFKITKILQNGEGRRIQISRAADQCRKLGARALRIFPDAARVASP